MASLAAVLREVRACRVCASHLPLGPRPVLRLAPAVRLLVIGQAPGTRVHATGVPWNDPSGKRLRAWLDLDSEVFYDRVAIMPMGFCYPGADARGADKPPRTECAPLWHARLRAFLPEIELTLLVGRYAQKYWLGAAAKSTLTETVRAWETYQPSFLPLPHPSWRNQAWLKRNPWFETEVLPTLRIQVARLLGTAPK